MQANQSRRKRKKHDAQILGRFVDNSSHDISAKSMAQLSQTSLVSKIRTYYVAADEVDWDYAPGGINRMMGMKFEGYSTVFTEQGPHRIGTVYRKAIYREYTDETFAHLKARAPEWQHAGILGPILRAEVGDTIRILFKNNASRPYSMHPHGVFYEKTRRAPLTTMARRAKIKTMTRCRRERRTPTRGKCPERAGPGPNDPSSIVWLYHSHTNELKDVESGLVGADDHHPSRHGRLTDGRPKDVEREFVCLYLLFDENVSWYIDHNIQTFTSDPKGVKKLEFAPVDNEGDFSGLGPDL